MPKEKSFWELSCEARPTVKANRDYKKRTKDTDPDVRLESTLVIVTARRWGKKTEWLRERRDSAEWLDIRAYDADDLECWLEQRSAVALEFAEDIGLIGEGVESVSRYWNSWASQCEPSILRESFFSDRQKLKERLLTGLHKRMIDGDTPPYAIRADSVDEAAAFVCAVLIEDTELANQALVVTDHKGWRFVEKHPDLKVAVVARPDIAVALPADTAALIVVPVAAGDMVSGFGSGSRDGRQFDLTLERPSIYAFKDALIENGVEESDARRLGIATGRSWTVFRRRWASNPAIRRPGWLDMPESEALSILCLFGSWSGDNAADRKLVEQLAACPCGETERRLRVLANVDDPPVLLIGQVWRAKSPLELLDLYAERITSDQIDRFLQIAATLLSEPDPQLELPEQERWMAQVHGKVRAQSGLLFDAVCDTLIKLAVRGPEFPSLAALSIEARVSNLVHRLLDDANATRWLSLASNLRPLAEAAPSTFLGAIEASLNRPDAPVARLISETSDASGLGGNCWHADLLWALEVLAWAPKWLPRVVTILGRLAHTPIAGNWSNTPLRSLEEIFRSWMPQTAAPLEQRIAALNLLIQQDPDIGFDLLDHLIRPGTDIAHGSARPVWREDDAGAGGRAPVEDYYGMLDAVAERIVASAEGNALRLVRALDKLGVLDPERASLVLSQVERFTDSSADDEDKEILRAKLREKLWWHLNFDESNPELLAEKLARWRDLYEKLAPADLVMRHRWLFSSDSLHMPIRSPENHLLDDETCEDWRRHALEEIYERGGMANVVRFAKSCGDPFSVGRCLIRLSLTDEAIAEWISQEPTEFLVEEPISSVVSGILRFLDGNRAHSIIRSVLASGSKKDWDSQRLASFLRLTRDERATWDFSASCGEEVDKIYWKIVYLHLHRPDSDELAFVMRRLLEADRPRTTLEVCQYDLAIADPLLLIQALEELLLGKETETALVQSWHIGEMLERLESCGELERDRLIRLEFGLSPLFRFEDEQKPKIIFEAVTSEPEIFAELVCLVYKPEEGEDRSKTATEAERQAAENAWYVLDGCRWQPGTQIDGTIDSDACLQFIDRARDLCRAWHRLTMCDQTLGQILAHAPVGGDGIWPGPPARDILNRPDLNEMRRGFQTGAFNKRGTTIRAPDAGGGQERGLASDYRRNADALQSTHPYLAQALDELAQSYESHGLREDHEAGLRRERY